MQRISYIFLYFFLGVTELSYLRWTGFYFYNMSHSFFEAKSRNESNSQLMRKKSKMNENEKNLNRTDSINICWNEWQNKQKLSLNATAMNFILLNWLVDLCVTFCIIRSIEFILNNFCLLFSIECDWQLVSMV